MNEKEKSKAKFNMILSIIGIVISIVCLLLEIFIIKSGIIFWLILLICNITILIGNYLEFKNSK